MKDIFFVGIGSRVAFRCCQAFSDSSSSWASVRRTKPRAQPYHARCCAVCPWVGASRKWPCVRGAHVASSHGGRLPLVHTKGDGLTLHPHDDLRRFLNLLLQVFYFYSISDRVLRRPSPSSTRVLLLRHWHRLHRPALRPQHMWCSWTSARKGRLHMPSFGSSTARLHAGSSSTPSSGRPRHCHHHVHFVRHRRDPVHMSV